MSVYEVRPENGGGRSRVLHRNLLLPCPYLPVEAPISKSKSTQEVPRKVTKRQPSTEGTSRNADDDMPNLTPHQSKELFASAGANVSEGYEHALVPAEQDADPFYADDANQEQGIEDSCEQVATSNDNADAVDEGLPRHSQRTSRPPLRMTYDVPGQPSFQPCKGFRRHTQSRYCNPTEYPGCCNLCGNTVVNILSTCTYKCSLGR